MLVQISQSDWNGCGQNHGTQMLRIGSELYMLGGVTGEGFVEVHTSTDQGLSWELHTTFFAGQGAKDPVLAVNGSVLTAVYAAKVGASSYTLVSQSWSTATPAVKTVTTLVPSALDIGSYDAATFNGTLYVAASLQEPSFKTGFHVTSVFDLGSGVTRKDMETSSWASGSVSGTLAFFVNGTTGLELYDTYRDKQFRFKDVSVQLRVRTFDGNTWGLPSTLFEFKARSLDHRIHVVLGPESGRLLSTTYQTHSLAEGEQSHVLYGQFLSGGWEFRQLMASPSASYRDGLIGYNGTDITLACLRSPRNVTGPGYAADGFLETSIQQPDGSLAQRHGAWDAVRFTALVGIGGTTPALSCWEVVGLNRPVGGSGVVPFFLSELSLPPVAVVDPATLTVKRGKDYTLSAALSKSQDLLPLSFTWGVTGIPAAYIKLTPSADGTSATLWVSKAIGPAASQAVVTVSVTDTTHPTPSTATCSVTVPDVPQIELSAPKTLALPRNAVLPLRATILYGGGNPVSVQWSQLSGMPVSLQDTTSQTVRVGALRSPVSGGDAVLRVVATDGVNRPVYADVVVTVPALDSSALDICRITRTDFASDAENLPVSISLRNSIGNWSTRKQGSLRSDTIRLKVVHNHAGAERFLYISPRSLNVVSQTQTSLFYRLRLPQGGVAVFDACHDDNDVSYLLTEANQIQVFSTPGASGVSDLPDDVITLPTPIAGKVFSRIACTDANLDGERLLYAWGSAGVLLLSLVDGEDGYQDLYHLSTDDGLLAGASEVLFVRVAQAHRLSEGQLLVGFKHPGGSTYEALVDIQERATVGVWDRTNTIGQVFTTGEILGKGIIHPTGTLPPTWNAPERVGGVYTLTWNQERADLVTGYEVWLQKDAAQAYMYSAIGSGTTRRVSLPTTIGHVYRLTVRARGSADVSEFSSELVIQP